MCINVPICVANIFLADTLSGRKSVAPCPIPAVVRTAGRLASLCHSKLTQSAPTPDLALRRGLALRQ